MQRRLRASLVLAVLALFSAEALSAESEGLTRVAAGKLELTLRQAEQGIALEQLRDTSTGRELSSSKSLPLFVLTLRRLGSTNDVALTADKGWHQSRTRSRSSRLELSWSRPADAALAGVSVSARAILDREHSAVRWKLRVDNRSTNWSVWRTVFPQLALGDLGTNAAVFFPRGPGEVRRGAWEKTFDYRGNYPDGWCAMQFFAAYRADESSGLYLAAQDPWGSSKVLTAHTDPKARAARFAFEYPARNMGLAGNSFDLEGEAVWALLQGDWYAAAARYRDWAQKEARWWPRGTERTDTPQWMRDLNAWVMTGGAPGECVPAVKQVREFLGLPLGFHWYNWHQVPFDNDYPHYFPTKEGFAQGVAALKEAGVFPMPYINGRLWDTHDRGAEDIEFSRVALRSATKNEDGKPFVETYSSKETNGEPVRLAVMCPYTPLWQNTVSNIVLRLLREEGTSGVYIDQVAAAAPKPCLDPTHGHPLGGGRWWNEGYWKMLENIRRAMPRGSMLTTECNSEPFIRWFDGYLTWHWQFDGQVPAFPAVYGGKVQMFGRAYRGGATKDLALRMKAGQQLVFGEQPGWLDPKMLTEKENAEFFRHIVQLRSNYSRFFSAGRMERPPKLLGEIPQVRADWQWSGEWWVSTDAVLAGAWLLPREDRLLLVFVNVSDSPVTTTVRYTGSGTKAAAKVLGSALTFPPRRAVAYEVTATRREW